MNSLSSLNSLFATTVGALALGLAIAGEPAQAFNVTYDFTIDIFKGPYTGTYTGNFTYDDASLDTKSLSEFLSPTKGGLSVVFNFLGSTYTQNSDLQFSQYPRAWFNQGNLLGLDFLVVPPTASPGFLFVPREFSAESGFYVGTTLDANNQIDFGTLADNEILYQLRSGGGKEGEPDPPSTGAVPEPSEVAGTLLALGLLGFGLRQRRRFSPGKSR